MKYGTKPNQFSIISPSRSGLQKVKIIDVIKVNIKTKTIEFITIENEIEYLKLNHDFFEYKVINVNDDFDSFIVGIDNDLKVNNPYTIKIQGHTELCYGNGFFVRIPRNGDLFKLKPSKLLLDNVRRIIQFK